MSRSPKRRATEREPVVSDEQLAAVGVVRVTPDLCRRCYRRPHVPLHEYCRACRYAMRGSKK
jgi:hypothetical protein